MKPISEVFRQHIKFLSQGVQMAIPEFQAFFKPLLEITADNNEYCLKEARERLTDIFNLSDEDLAELIPSGSQTRFVNRVQWAKIFLTKAKALLATKRGCFCITDRGKELLNQGHDKIDNKILAQYPEFVEFRSPNKKAKDSETSSKEPADLPNDETPEESLEKAYQSIRHDLAGSILEQIKSNSPTFFEHLVVDLMVAMGYGGSRHDAGKSVGKSGDEGIDGIIKEDKLGLDVIYLQAKRWEGSVGSPEIQKFAGALQGKQAKKGVFITTGKFTKGAHGFAAKIESKIILIDGWDLANYMVDFNLGVSTTAKYELKRVDSDYFTEE